MRIRALLGSLTALLLLACSSSSGATAPGSSSESAGDSEATASAAGGTHCGVERWSVKTGTDPDAARINPAAIADTTVAQLVALNAGHPQADAVLKAHARSRIAPVETTVYRLQHVRLTGWKQESDSDLHLVLKDGGQQMIAEIPLPGCVGSSPFAAQIAQARRDFTTRYAVLSGPALNRVDQPVTLTGIGFWDFLHGQDGVAPNAVELHPVLSIQFA